MNEYEGCLICISVPLPLGALRNIIVHVHEQKRKKEKRKGNVKGEMRRAENKLYVSGKRGCFCQNLLKHVRLKPVKGVSNLNPP